MDVCPFCNAEVDEELVLYGGTCPHCLNPIPGEEAPTDPGAQALSAAEVEAEVQQSSTPSRGPLFAALFVGVIALGGGGWYYTTVLSAEAPPAELPEITINRDLSGHVNPDVPEDEEAEARATANAPRETPPPERVVTASVSKPPPTGGRVDEAASPPEQPARSNLGPPRPSALGEFDIGAGPSINVGGLPAAKVLSSPSEIDQMIARSISARGRQVRACYESRLKTIEDLAGTWSVSFVVQPDGSAGRVAVSGRDTSDSVLESCLKRKVEAWRFQKIVKAHPVTVPFKFTPN